jgi:hypothetical protein
VVDAASAVVGVNVAVEPLTLRVAAIDVVPLLNVKVVVLMVAGSTALLNVAFTVVLELTPVAPFPGVVELTANGVGPELAVKITSTQ